MNIVQYSAVEHYEVLSAWWRGHGQTPPAHDLLPSSGVVVPGICAGFLYAAEAAGFLDWFISNPQFREKRAKHEALDMVSEALLRLADQMNLKRVSAHTSSVPQTQRGLRYGFRRKTVTLLEKHHG